MGNLTKYYRLYKPDISEVDWGDWVNNNFDVIDKELKNLERLVYKLYTSVGRYINRLQTEVNIQLLPVPIKQSLETSGFNTEIDILLLPVPIKQSLETSGFNTEVSIQLIPLPVYENLETTLNTEVSYEITT